MSKVIVSNILSDAAIPTHSVAIGIRSLKNRKFRGGKFMVVRIVISASLAALADVDIISGVVRCGRPIGDAAGELDKENLVELKIFYCFAVCSHNN